METLPTELLPLLGSAGCSELASTCRRFRCLDHWDAFQCGFGVAEVSYVCVLCGVRESLTPTEHVHLGHGCICYFPCKAQDQQLLPTVRCCYDVESRLELLALLRAEFMNASEASGYVWIPEWDSVTCLPCFRALTRMSWTAEEQETPVKLRELVDDYWNFFSHTQRKDSFYEPVVHAGP